MTESRTLAQIAELVGGTVRGDPSICVDNAAAIRSAASTSITWITNPKYATDVASSRAAAILAPADQGPTPMPAILCHALDAAVGMVINLFAPPSPSPPVGVHPSAVIATETDIAPDVAIGPFVVVDAGASIGARTIIHAGVHIGAAARIGNDCRLWNNVVVRERCTLGHRVTIHPNAVIGADGYGYFLAQGRHNKIAHGGIVTIGDDVEIGACTCIDRAKLGETIIGAGTKIDNLAQVGHNAHVGENCLLVAHAALAGSVTLEDYVVLAGHAGVAEHCVVGKGTVVSSFTAVAHDVAPGTVLSGSPARVHRKRLRAIAAGEKVPGLIRNVKRLDERVDRLESAADNT